MSKYELVIFIFVTIELLYYEKIYKVIENFAIFLF